MITFSRSDFRLLFLAVVIFAALGCLVLRLWVLQVMKGQYYASKIRGKQEITVRIPSVRGEIRDRNGLPLVRNRAIYNVDFYLPDMVDGFKARYGKVPRVTVRRTEHGMQVDENVPDIQRIVMEGISPRLDALNLARDYEAKLLKKQFETNTLVPFTYIENADFPTIARFSEHDVGLPGVGISEKPVREYVYGAFAPHLLGYVRTPQDYSLLPDIGDYNYYQPDVVGALSVEKAMDAHLRGKPGVRVLQKDVKGNIESELRVDPPKPGANVYLTLDARIQYIAEQALRHPAIGRAAAVVMDPNNGEILAMASVPSFDPNIFIPSVKTAAYKALNDNPTHPLVNRAVSGHPPGSTFKLVTALAGLTKGMAGSHYTCNGYVEYGTLRLHCHVGFKGGAHGSLGLTEAIKVSCNAFFYQYGNAAGGATLERVGRTLGVGQSYHLGLSENPGIMPGPEWLRGRYPHERWGAAQTALTSIGQGYTSVSPLQMAVVYSTIANGGVIYEPRLVKTVKEFDGAPALTDAGKEAVPDAPKIREDLRDRITLAQMDVVRKGLWRVVNEDGGTGKAARIKGVVVAGKTGTADTSDSDRAARGKSPMTNTAWFCSFAPFENPRYVVVVAVMADNSHGGTTAAPVAARILEQIFEIEQEGKTVDLKPLAPANNPRPFQPIPAMPPYPGSSNIVVDAPGEEEDESTGDEGHEGEPAAVQFSQTRDAAPDLRAEADDEGRARNIRNKPAATPTPAPKATPKSKETTARPGTAEPERRGFFGRIFGPKEKKNP